MIGYYTDNSVSHGVMDAVKSAGFEVRHIKDFIYHRPAIFYGILRGAGLNQYLLSKVMIDWWYIDNGYMDAVYVDKSGYKRMEGTYRICKNKKLEQYTESPVIGDTPKSMLIIPPSEATAFADGTTIEDWYMSIKKYITMPYNIRTKDDPLSLSEHISKFDGVFAYNSMAVMEAVRQGKSVHTTNGIFPFTESMNSHYYNYEKLRTFYTDRQYTLEQIAKGASCLNLKSL